MCPCRSLIEIGGTPESGLSLPLFEDNMNRPEFKQYLRSYCSEVGRVLPDYDERTKLFHEFSKVKYSDQTDLECELWEFFDRTLMAKKEPVNTTTTIAFASLCQTCPMPCATPKAPWPCKKQEKEDTMTYNETEASRKYLNTRLNDAQYAKRDELYKIFNLGKPSTPQTYNQLIDAIKNDNYTLNTKRTVQIDAVVAAGDYNFCNPLDGIKFNLPDAPDFPGYEAAEKDASKQVTAAKDVINTSNAADGLKALQAFEAWLPTPVTTTAQ